MGSVAGVPLVDFTGGDHVVIDPMTVSGPVQASELHNTFLCEVAEGSAAESAIPTVVIAPRGVRAHITKQTGVEVELPQSLSGSVAHALSTSALSRLVDKAERSSSRPSSWAVGSLSNDGRRCLRMS